VRFAKRVEPIMDASVFDHIEDTGPFHPDHSALFLRGSGGMAPFHDPRQRSRTGADNRTTRRGLPAARDSAARNAEPAVALYSVLSNLRGKAFGQVDRLSVPYANG
jgi:hypothetical protein